MRDYNNGADILQDTRHIQVKASVDRQIAPEFKKAAAAPNVSRATVLSRFMAGYYNGKVKGKPVSDYSTRRRRGANTVSWNWNGSGLLRGI